jgi:hypothetical protein
MRGTAHPALGASVISKPLEETHAIGGKRRPGFVQLFAAVGR